MKTMVAAMAMAMLAGCGGGAFGDAGPGAERSECCDVRGASLCASDGLVVQWDNATWSDRPDEVAANGECITGHVCTVYLPTDGGLTVVGDGTCH